MATTKADLVSQIKRTNNRLKVVGETCLNIAEQRDTRPQERVQKQLAARLDRELTADDSAGAALRDAVELFWHELHSGADYEHQSELASAVYGAVRQVQVERWQRMEAKHGKVSNYFGRFGQIKEQYRRAAPKTIRDYGKATTLPIGWILLVILVATMAWWFA